MTRNQAVEILENMPKDIYTLDGISPIRTESWSLKGLHKQFVYKGNNQNIVMDCIINWREETFNLALLRYKTKQDLPFVYNKIGEKMIAYLSVFGLKRDFYL